MEHAPAQSLNRVAFQATIHCLTGCAIGEILGLVIATALGWHNLPSIVLAIVLAFAFGYGLTMRPLLAGGLPFRRAARTALAADTVSIVVMEISTTRSSSRSRELLQPASSTGCSGAASPSRSSSPLRSRCRSTAGWSRAAWATRPSTPITDGASMTPPTGDPTDAPRRMTRLAHWQNQYATRAPDAVGWYEADPSMSRRLVAEALQRGARSVIDVGGGASSLVDHLVDKGVPVAVLDIAEAGLAFARERLGERAERVTWIVADVTTATDIGRFDVWHDRAVFHFLTEPADRAAYVALGDADDRARRDGTGRHLRSRWTRTVQRAPGLSLRAAALAQSSARHSDSRPANPIST